LSNPKQPRPVRDKTFTQVYTQAYPGPTYTVKYLGIVDGSMGILSRKMALAGTDPVVKPLSTVDHGRLPDRVNH
jgi:hypothetical protein